VSQELESIKRGTLTASVAQQVILAVEGKTVTALASRVNGATAARHWPSPGGRSRHHCLSNLPQLFAVDWHGVAALNPHGGVAEIGQPTSLISAWGTVYRSV